MSYLKNKTVIVPFDFSDFSKSALDTALEMAEESTSLHVVHVVEPTPTMISVDPSMAVPASNDPECFQYASEEMQKIVENGKYKRFKAHCELGDAGTKIVDLAKSLRADLIVISSHGRSGLTRLLLGSVAERVLRLSDCPVLVLRGQTDES